MELNKKGFVSLTLIVFVIFIVMLLIVLGIMVYGFNIVSDSFNTIDFTLVNKSFNQTYTETLGNGVDSMRTVVPRTMALGIIFGMILVMVLIGYFFIEIDSLWFIFDVFVLIAAEILAFQLSSSFSNYVNSDETILALYQSGGPLYEASVFVLGLPLYLPVVAVLVICATYIFSKKRNKEGQPIEF